MSEKDIIGICADDDGTVSMMLVSKSGVALTWRDTPDRARWMAQELFAAADRADGRKAMEKLKVCGG